MRAFLVVFLGFTSVLCAQERPDFDVFQQNVAAITKEINAAYEGEIPINYDWMFERSERLQSILKTAGELKSDPSLAVREAVNNIDFDPLITRLRFVNQRFEAETAVSNWDWEDFYHEMRLIEGVLKQTEDGIKFQYQPQQISITLFRAEVLTMIVQNNKFWKRLCKDKDDECLTGSSVKLTAQVSSFLKQLIELNKKANTWPNPPPIEPSLPNNEGPKPATKKPD
jgi:hypothetical protein